MCHLCIELFMHCKSKMNDSCTWYYTNDTNCLLSNLFPSLK